MVQYNGSETANVERFYGGLEGNPAISVTNTLRQNLTSQNLTQARIDYARLLRTLGSTGYKGKDIRYAERELRAIEKHADSEAIKTVARIFADQLPTPVEKRDRVRAKLAERRRNLVEIVR